MVISTSQSGLLDNTERENYLRLEPVMEPNDIGMFHSLQQNHLIIYHLLVTLNILLEDDLDRVSLPAAFCLSNNPIRSCAKCPTKSILGSRVSVSV